jgi:excisionase family DNA binding protein
MIRQGNAMHDIEPTTGTLVQVDAIKRDARALNLMVNYLCSSPCDCPQHVLDQTYVDLLAAVLVDVVGGCSRSGCRLFTTADVMRQGRVSHDEQMVVDILSAAVQVGAIRPIEPGIAIRAGVDRAWVEAGQGVWESVDPDPLDSSRFNEAIDRLRSRLPWPGPPAHTDHGNATPPKLVTAREAAKLLGCSERTLWTITDRKELPVVRIGRRVSYDTRDLSSWIEAQKVRG